jgi:predicted MFS family arabinose efflux permease
MKSNAPLYWMALGAFAIGTESFMIAALLPDIAAGLSVSEQAAGQLVSVFALTYAASSPVLTVATGRVSRRVLLIGTMAAFALANLIAAVMPNYTGLMVARVLLAMGAGLFVPNATAVAGALASAEERGTALSIVTSGLSLAIVFGVPLGALVGASLGWRMTVVGMAALSVLATIGLHVGLPRTLASPASIPGMRERVAVLANPSLRNPLVVTMLWAMGPFTVYPFLAIVLRDAAGLSGAAVGIVLLVWGASAFAGLAAGGRLTDSIGPNAIIGCTLVLTALALFSLTVSASLTQGPTATLALLAGIIVWGAAAWGFYPAQQARLIALAGVENASVILSVNASFHYLGFSIGAALGSLVLAYGPSRDLGLAGGLCVVAACLLEFLRIHRHRSVAAAQ